MEVVRLPFNDYAYAHVRKLEERAGAHDRLSPLFKREIGKLPRAIYLGVYDEAGDLAGAARLVTEPLGVVLLDILAVAPGHPERDGIEWLLVQEASDLAAQEGKRLSVLAFGPLAGRWERLGFRIDARTLMTLD
jgi:hypothetical protein